MRSSLVYGYSVGVVILLAGAAFRLAEYDLAYSCFSFTYMTRGSAGAVPLEFFVRAWADIAIAVMALGLGVLLVTLNRQLRESTDRRPPVS